MAEGNPILDPKTRFESVVWCADIINRPGIKTFGPVSRSEDQSEGVPDSQDQLFRRSLYNENTVPSFLGIYLDPAENPTGSFLPSILSGQPVRTSSENEKQRRRLYIHESAIIFDLQPGVNGYNGGVHGGFIAALIDEAMGSWIYLNHKLQSRFESGTLPPGVQDLNELGFFTAGMNMRLIRPISTPQIVIVIASFRKFEGRKLIVDVSVKGEKGVEYANCEGLWISVAKPKMKI